MITRLKAKGFKSLLDVDIRFGPFTCIAGANAVGKSNLFDCIRFLQLLTEFPIMEAVKLLRETKGRSPEPRALFTSFGSFSAPKMSFEVEMLVDRKVEDELGVTADAAISSLRYTLEFQLSQSDDSRLELAYEALEPIKVSEARRSLGFPATRDFVDSAAVGVRRGGAFISTDRSNQVITVHQEGHGGRKVTAAKSSRTVVGATPSSDFPTILAAHREMASWRTMLLEPSAMRAPSLYGDARSIDSRGANLPATLKRLATEAKPPGRVYSELSNRLAELVEDVRDVRVVDDQKTETLTAEMQGRDGVFRPARSLSDGTLRFLVLATLALDPEAQGVICLEEPENGIHPDRIEKMVQLLKDVSLNADYKVSRDNPLRQVLINTHSPRVVEHVSKNDLVYFDSLVSVVDGSEGRITKPVVPANTWRARIAERGGILARARLRPYLRTDDQMDMWESDSVASSVRQP